MQFKTVKIQVGFFLGFTKEGFYHSYPCSKQCHHEQSHELMCETFMTMASMITCMCDSSQGNMREPDMNGRGRRRAGGRVGVLLSSLGSLEGTETLFALLTLPRSFFLFTMADLNNLSHIIYL